VRVAAAHFHRKDGGGKRLIRHYQPLAQFGVKFGVKIERFFRFLPASPTSLPFAVNNLDIFHFHGMEEVVGSIPTRSTKPFSDLHEAEQLSVVPAVVPLSESLHDGLAAASPSTSLLRSA
jgi:hypothetical protein